MSQSSTSKKLITVIGATGAQGLAVINALLKPSPDGTPSPYAVRALTRDTTSQRAQDLKAKGVELAQGQFEDFESIKKAFDGAYGAYVNTDGFTVGEMIETHAGMRIFEIAKSTPTMRHYVYSGLDDVFKRSGYKEDYYVEHFAGKARNVAFLQSQDSDVKTMTWTAIKSGPYMEMLAFAFLAPLNIRADGTRVFASPIADGHIDLIALQDFGWWARYTFDHRETSSGQILDIVSARIGWEELVETFKRVTGLPAVFKRQTIEEWWGNFDFPTAPAVKPTGGLANVKDNFSAFWRLWRDDITKKDLAWNEKMHPGHYTVERWMIEHKYDGSQNPDLFKGPSKLKVSARTANL